MKNITKVILLICMIAEAENAFAQWSFSMSVSFVGRDCGVANSYLATINQSLGAATAENQYSTKEQCMAERSVVQSIVNEALNYNVSGLDCRVVITLSGCSGNDMMSNTLQLGVSKDAAFQSSNPANEVNDWIEMHDSLIWIIGDTTKNEEPLNQTDHINDFINVSNQIEHVGTSNGAPAKYSFEYDPDVNYKLATDHKAPTFDWDNVYNYKEEEIIAKPLPKPRIHFEEEYEVKPISVPSDDSELDDFMDGALDVAGDVTKTAVDVYQIWKYLVAGAEVASVVGIIADAAISLAVEDLKAVYQVAYHGLWKGEPVVLSTSEILTNAAKNTAIGTVLDVGATALNEGRIDVENEKTYEAGSTIVSEVGRTVLEEVDELSKGNPLGTMLSIGTRATKYIGRIIGKTDASEEY